MYLLISLLVIIFQGRYSDTIIDSNYTLEEALSGMEIPADIRRSLVLVDVNYYSFDGRLHRGQVVIHKALAEDIRKVFRVIEEERFPVGKVVPIVRYGWSDELSMKDNNTSAFNYRRVKGTRVLSYHARGRAIDINPMQNPFCKRGVCSPEGAEYRKDRPGTILISSRITAEFIRLGWKWGGRWRSSKDYQHFEKR